MKTIVLALILFAGLLNSSCNKCSDRYADQNQEFEYFYFKIRTSSGVTITQNDSLSIQALVQTKNGFRYAVKDSLFGFKFFYGNEDSGLNRLNLRITKDKDTVNSNYLDLKFIVLSNQCDVKSIDGYIANYNGNEIHNGKNTTIENPKILVLK